MENYEIPVRQSTTDFPEPEQPAGEGSGTAGEGSVKYGILNFDQLPPEHRIKALKAWQEAPDGYRNEAARAAIGFPTSAYYAAPDDTVSDAKPRPTMKTSLLAAVLLVLALLAGYLLSRGDDALSRAMEARATAARELSAATVAYDAAKTRYGAAKARYEAAYRLESCLISLTGAAGSGSCR